MTTLTPWIFFNGQCREAMHFYQSIFGGELQMDTYGDGPPDAHTNQKANSPEFKDKIMHSRLMSSFHLMACDHPDWEEAHVKDTFSLSVEGQDEALLTNAFEKLSEGGTVTSPLQKMFWGATFGMVNDRYGVQWMISINPNAPGV